MPYIAKDDRKKFKEILEKIDQVDISIKGELEFLIFYLQKHFMKGKKWSYTNLHDTVYAAMHCADEYRRRYLDKREDEAIAANGDIP